MNQSPRRLALVGLALLMSIVAIGASAFSGWMGYRAGHRAAAVEANLQAQLKQLQSQIKKTDAAQLAKLENEIKEALSTADSNSSKLSHAEEQLTKLSTTNDRQWQELDYLKTQRIAHDKKIKQLETDADRQRVESRNLDRKISQLRR